MQAFLRPRAISASGGVPIGWARASAMAAAGSARGDCVANGQGADQAVVGELHVQAGAAVIEGDTHGKKV